MVVAFTKNENDARNSWLNRAEVTAQSVEQKPRETSSTSKPFIGKSRDRSNPSQPTPSKQCGDHPSSAASAAPPH
jgi:hypothetical protein